MADTFIGQIHLFPFNFAPKGFAFCQGQLLAISQNTALFSLLGTTYGGNGTTNFALPNLQGQVPVGFGQGPGLSLRVQGETGGSDTVTLAVTQLPAHGHALTSTLTAMRACKNSPGNQLTPAQNLPAAEGLGSRALYSTAAPDANMNAAAIAVGGIDAPVGGGLPHNNLQPYLTLNYCIALSGVFPSRN